MSINGKVVDIIDEDDKTRGQLATRASMRWRCAM
jgi:hypothetical protein